MPLLSGIGKFLLSTLEQVVFAVAIFMIIYLFFLQPHQVDGLSMIPSFQDGEYLLTDKISYKFTSPKRGDVIVFAAPPDRQRDFIKRIIATPGERVSLKEGKVFINDKQIQEAYLEPSLPTSGGPALGGGEFLSLKEEEYFVLGDNRTHSSDSRTFGIIKKQDIIGRAWVVYWPPTKLRIIPTISYAGL